MPKAKICSIDIFRYFCALLVVAAHSAPFGQLGSVVFTQITPGIALPFFFATAGYFYCQKLERGERAFVPYLCRLLTTYGFWTVLYYIVDFFWWGSANLKSYAIESVLNFFVWGSHYHFWFFPALIATVCATTVLFKLGGRKCVIGVALAVYTLFQVACFCSKLGISIPVWNTLYAYAKFDEVARVITAFPFFVAGYMAYVWRDHPWLRRRRALTAAWLGVGIGWFGYMLWSLCAKQAMYSLGLTQYVWLFLTIVWLVQHPMPRLHKASEICRALAGFTYYAHPLVLWVRTFNLSWLSWANSTVWFFVAVAITAIGGILLYQKRDFAWVRKILY